MFTQGSDLDSTQGSNPGSTHFRSRTEFQSTNGCRLSQPGLQSGVGGVRTCIQVRTLVKTGLMSFIERGSPLVTSNNIIGQ